MKPKLYILAGANGSGKSTISKVLLPAEGIVYINPDDIAWELNPENPVAVQIQAGKETLKRIDALLNRGDSFAIESTLSGLGYLSVIKHAKALGYDVFICYTFVDSPEVCIARIEGRVKKGGHFVPPEDVRRRYYRSKRNFFAKYSSEADYWMLCYNGGDNPAVVAECYYGKSKVVFQDPLFEKFKEDIYE